MFDWVFIHFRVEIGDSHPEIGKYKPEIGDFNVVTGNSNIEIVDFVNKVTILINTTGNFVKVFAVFINKTDNFANKVDILINNNDDFVKTFATFINKTACWLKPTA